MPGQALPANIVFAYAYTDGSGVRNAVPVKVTAHSQTADFLVYNADGTTELKTSVRHQSSGDPAYWSIGAPSPTT